MNKINLTLSMLLLLSVTLGCLGPSSAESRCEGKIEYDGKTIVGKAKDEKQAGLNACNRFCLETDSEFDGMYQIWLDSSDGKDLAETLKRKPTKFESTMEDNRLLDYVTKNCANKCVKEANQGKHKLEVSCKK